MLKTIHLKSAISLNRNNSIEFSAYSDPFITLRIPLKPAIFRPAATGLKYDDVKLRVNMELLEVLASKFCQKGYISCAAHYDKDLAVINARNEAIERISLAAWWALRRPSLRQIKSNYLTDFITNDNDFSAVIGLIPSEFSSGNTVICIIKNENKYPYSVLGCAHDISLDKATNKAIFEAIQSWIGSIWYKVNSPKNLPAWDLKELENRFQEIDSLSLTTNLVRNNTQKIDISRDLKTRLKNTPQGSVAWMYPKVNTKCQVPNLLPTVIRGETIYVFTRPNW